MTPSTDPDKNKDQFNERLVRVEEEEKEMAAAYKLDDERTMLKKSQENAAKTDMFKEDLSPVINDVLHCLTDDDPKRAYRPGVDVGFRTMINLVKGWKTMDQTILCAEAEAVYMGEQ